MTDIRLVWNPELGAADFGIKDNDLEQDDTFETSLLLSIFTDAPAKPGDVVPPELEGKRGGWWADALAAIAGDKFGSRLWLLRRVKQEPTVLTRAREYVLEALEWMLVDKVTDRIEVATEILRPGVLLLTVTVYRPKRKPETFKYDYNWQRQVARRAA